MWVCRSGVAGTVSAAGVSSSVEGEAGMVSAADVFDSAAGEVDIVGAADKLGSSDSSAEGETPETDLLCAAGVFNSSRTVRMCGVV